jgi:surface antigen
VNRFIGATLRRTAGGGVILGLGFTALTATPQEVTPVSASASTNSISAAWPASDRLPNRRPYVAVTESSPSVKVLAPVATAAVSVRPSPRKASSHPTAARRAAPAAIQRPVALGGGASRFAYGYCTWWVAHRRSIPWRGNAAQWWWNARPFGYAEGSVPRVGAIMVMGAGGSASSVGHVAYVERVNANGTFVVSEMNWWGVAGGGWDRVDYRTVTSMRGILGFIY